MKWEGKKIPKKCNDCINLHIKFDKYSMEVIEGVCFLKECKYKKHKSFFK